MGEEESEDAGRRRGAGAVGAAGAVEADPVWDMDGPEFECECPGPPPPPFHVPPPPRPPFLLEPDCSELPISDLETCQAVPVIDAEYHSSPAIPSLAIIVIIVLAVVALLSFITILVVCKRRKMQNLLPRKSSPQNHCDPTGGNSVVYEDLPTLRARPLPHCPPHTLPSIEMMDMNRYPNHGGFSPVFICPPSVPEAYATQDMFNPVYEELSNGSGERGETDSEGLPGRLSEDEFAEDELSLGGEVEHVQPVVEERRSGASSLQGSTGHDPCRDVDSPDADDRCRFLVHGGRNNFSLPPGYRDKDRRVPRGKTSEYCSHQRPKSLDRRRGWRSNKPPPAAPPPHPNEFHEGFLLDTLLTMYPRPAAPHPRQEIFTTFRAAQSGSDSGYSYNTSGGRTSLRGRKDVLS